MHAENLLLIAYRLEEKQVVDGIIGFLDSEIVRDLTLILAEFVTDKNEGNGNIAAYGSGTVSDYIPMVRRTLDGLVAKKAVFDDFTITLELPEERGRMVLSVDRTGTPYRLDLSTTSTPDSDYFSQFKETFASTLTGIGHHERYIRNPST